MVRDLDSLPWLISYEIWVLLKKVIALSMLCMILICLSLLYIGVYIELVTCEYLQSINRSEVGHCMGGCRYF